MTIDKISIFSNNKPFSNQSLSKLKDARPRNSNKQFKFYTDASSLLLNLWYGAELGDLITVKLEDRSSIWDNSITLVSNLVDNVLTAPDYLLPYLRLVLSATFDASRIRQDSNTNKMSTADRFIVRNGLSDVRMHNQSVDLQGKFIDNMIVSLTNNPAEWIKIIYVAYLIKLQRSRSSSVYFNDRMLWSLLSRELGVEVVDKKLWDVSQGRTRQKETNTGERSKVVHIFRSGYPYVDPDSEFGFSTAFGPGSMHPGYFKSLVKNVGYRSFAKEVGHAPNDDEIAVAYAITSLLHPIFQLLLIDYAHVNVSSTVRLLSKVRHANTLAESNYPYWWAGNPGLKSLSMPDAFKSNYITARCVKDYHSFLDSDLTEDLMSGVSGFPANALLSLRPSRTDKDNIVSENLRSEVMSALDDSVSSYLPTNNEVKSRLMGNSRISHYVYNSTINGWGDLGEPFEDKVGILTKLTSGATYLSNLLISDILMIGQSKKIDLEGSKKGGADSTREASLPLSRNIIY